MPRGKHRTRFHPFKPGCNDASDGKIQMPIMIGGARMIGDDFHCHLVEYMRTSVYKIPGLKVGEPKPAPCFILEEPEFRASMVVDPFAYLRDEGISDQFEFEDNFQVVLSEACPPLAPASEASLYLVIQFKEDLNAFAAVDGQCRRVCFDGVEQFVLVECGDPYTPNPNQKKRTINAVLTAVKGEFGVTDGMVPCFNTYCYRASGGQCVLPYVVRTSEAVGQATRPIGAREVSDRAGAAAALVTQIEKYMQASHSSSETGHAPKLGGRLEELIEALQLDETRDQAYWRLWYLQLFDRLEKFGEQCRPRLQLGNQEGLKEEYNHRNLIAHRGVNRIDGRLLRSIQTKVTGIIKRQTSA